MIRAVFVVLLAVAMAGSGFAAGAEDAIVAAEKAWGKAVTTQDFAALEKVLSPDLIYAHSTGVIETKSDYLGKLKSGVQKYDAIIHQKTTVKMHGGAAVAHSIVLMQGTSAAGPFDNKLMMIHFWVNSGGRWQLAAHQTTRLTE